MSTNLTKFDKSNHQTQFTHNLPIKSYRYYLQTIIMLWKGTDRLQCQQTNNYVEETHYQLSATKLNYQAQEKFNTINKYLFLSDYLKFH